MARPETLVPGNCYFSVGFFDSKLLVPMIETLVYVGQEDHPEEGRLWLFTEPESPPDPDELNGAPESTALIVISDRDLHEITDFDGLMQRLREISADHPLRQNSQPAAEPATDEDVAPISGEVARFLSDPECVGLTMTIRYTGAGLSLGRREGELEMSFFPRPRRDPGVAAGLLSLFAGIGVQPHDDYFANGGRTRVLAFTIPNAHEAIVDLCKRVLTEVYSMRHGDVLDYHPLRKADVPLLDTR
jgi:hypothetical protein